MPKPIITVKNISKKYLIDRVKSNQTLAETLAEIPKQLLSVQSRSKKKDFWALKDINFKVYPNEVVGIIGRNGSGKSTLLKILSRITYPTTGEAQIEGNLASLLEVGTGFNPELTGRENIFLNGSILGMTRKEIERKFDEIVEFSGVDTFIDTPVKRYSSGMYVRLAFAVAAHLDPDILIIDEVLAVGDIGFQKKCLKKMDEVTKTAGRTVLFVSHNLEMVRQICSRCILLDKGEIVYIGTTDKAIKKYYKILRNMDLSSEEKSVPRISSGHVSITSFKILDTNNKNRFEYEVGEDIFFKIKYKINADIKKLAVYLAFKSSKNDEILTSIHHKIKSSPLVAGETGSILIKIPKVNLRPHTYPIKIYVGEAYGLSGKYEVLDNSVSPLTIIATKQMNYSTHYDELKSIGYYSIVSQIIKEGNYAK